MMSCVRQTARDFRLRGAAPCPLCKRNKDFGQCAYFHLKCASFQRSLAAQSSHSPCCLHPIPTPGVDYLLLHSPAASLRLWLPAGSGKAAHPARPLPPAPRPPGAPLAPGAAPTAAELDPCRCPRRAALLPLTASGTTGGGERPRPLFPPLPLLPRRRRPQRQYRTSRTGSRARLTRPGRKTARSTRSATSGEAYLRRKETARICFRSARRTCRCACFP